MIVFPCHVCRTQLSAREDQAGQLVRCPSCLTALRVPTVAENAAAALTAMGNTPSGPPPLAPPSYVPPPPDDATEPAGGGLAQGPAMPPPPGSAPAPGGWAWTPAPRPVGKRYGFNCGYCSSRLEANEAMAAQEGQCPTCGNTITIPIIDRYGRLIDPKTRQIIRQDPHPVHAYAAAGERAPQILRGSDGKQIIRCPRCGGASPITANNCKGCAMPFTMEGTTIEAAGASNGFGVAALVLGIVGLIPCTFAIASVLALIFGIVGHNRATSSGEPGGKAISIAGAILGGIGILIAILVWSNVFR